MVASVQRRIYQATARLNQLRNDLVHRAAGLQVGIHRLCTENGSVFHIDSNLFQYLG